MAAVIAFSSRFKWSSLLLAVFYLICTHDCESSSSSATYRFGFIEFYTDYISNWIINSSLWYTVPSTCWSRPPGSTPFRPRDHKSVSAVFVALLLLSGDIEVNPGPVHITVGSVNARSAVRNAAEVCDLIHSHSLDVTAIWEARSAYTRDKLQQQRDNPRELWRTVKSLLHPGRQRQWFDGQNTQSLATRLSSFFTDKVASAKSAAEAQLKSAATPTTVRPVFRRHHRH